MTLSKTWHDPAVRMPQESEGPHFVVIAKGEHFVATYTPHNYPGFYGQEVEEGRFGTNKKIESVEAWMEIPDLDL